LSYVDTYVDGQSSNSSTAGGVTTTTTTYKRTYIRTTVDLYTPPGQLVLSVDGSGRYLIDGNNNPFLLIGDSPQGMISDITPAQMATYMANRQGYGVNMIQVHMLSGSTFGGTDTTFPAEDGTTPFTSTGDISTPRAAYFAQVDDLINLAASYGMVVMLNVAEMIDAESLFQSNGNTKCYNFGAYLGARYKDFPNLIWCVGNDWQDWASNSAARDAVKNVLDGILSQDNNHLVTTWLNYHLSASRNIEADWGGGYITLDGAYTYYPTYDDALDEYGLSPAKPVFLMESNYEGEGLMGYTTTPLDVRKQNYWVMLSGGCGITYCNDEIWQFASGWGSHLDSYDGPGQLVHLRSLLEAYAWYNMIPDSAHAILTAGYGTYANGTSGSINTNDYAACASDGSVILIYMPTNRTMTVQSSGTKTCRWFDPTNGSFTADAASPVSSWPHDFSRAGANSGGDHDWVLVLED
jgi:Protein of unknown function (DUF4038)/Putative collagen-binding domain of a collagenase